MHRATARLLGISETPAPRFPEAEPYFVGDERTNRERMLAGDWYVADNPGNARIAARAHTMFHHFERTFVEGEEDCWDLLRSVIPGLGDKTHLLPLVRVNYGNSVAMGEGTSVNYGLTALDTARTSISTHYQVGSSAQLLIPARPLEPTPRACPLETVDSITIGDNVWLGGRVIVHPGTTTGDNCVIDAGSVVIKDISTSSLAVDNPVRVLCQLDSSAFNPRHQHPPQETSQ